MRSVSPTNKAPCRGGCGIKVVKAQGLTCGAPDCELIFKTLRKVEAKRVFSAPKKTPLSKKDKARKNEIKTLGKLMSNCQTHVNRYINYRDKDKPCISCLEPINGGREAGHFIAKAASSGGTITRFNYSNINTQCHKCNYYGWDKEAYRAEHAKRYGEDALTEVDRLHAQALKEGFNPSREWVADIQKKAIADLKRLKLQA